MPASDAAGAPALLQRIVDTGAKAREGWRESANYAGEYAEREGEHHDLPVGPDFVDARQGFRQPADSDPERNIRDQQTGATAGNAEHQAFEHCLAKPSAGGCA